MSQVADENRLAKKELRIDRKMNPKSGLSNYNFWMLCSCAPLLGLPNCYVPYCTTYSGACYSMQLQILKTKICG
jgi:hypothetical protein